MIATTASANRFSMSARCAPARRVAAQCMKAPEPETDAVPPSTSAGGVKDATSVQLDVPSQAVDTAVLGPVQGEHSAVCDKSVSCTAFELARRTCLPASPSPVSSQRNKLW